MEDVIQPHVGYGRLKLGSTKAEVMAVLGVAEAETRDPDVDCDTWLYQSGALELNFDDDDGGRLSRITVSSCAAKLAGHLPIKSAEATVLKYFPGLEFDEDFEENGKSYYDKEQDLMFWFVDGVLENISVFPKYTQDGSHPKWP
ncbi:MAG: hypothetical protein RLW61_08535 [Gammaproteobacteria bacterium]